MGLRKAKVNFSSSQRLAEYAGLITLALLLQPAEDIGVEWCAGRLESLTAGVRTTRAQRCWVHKTDNILNKLAKSEASEGQSGAARNLDGGHPAGG
jgi:hypothetical protein